MYEICGFDAESNPSTLTMLTDLEAKLEELLTQIEEMPEEYVEHAEKKKKEKDVIAYVSLYFIYISLYFTINYDYLIMY